MTIKDHNLKNENGGILLIMSVFMTLMLGLMILSVDGYFQLQSRLDEQNIAEYLTMAAMAGYESDPEADFVMKRENAILYLQSIQDTNQILGVESSSGWDFHSRNCSGATCSGDNWTLYFGRWESNQMLIPESEDEEDPEAIDSAFINAALLELKLETSDLIEFFKQRSDEEESMLVSSVSYIHQISVDDRVLKVAKTYAGGKAFSAEAQ